MRAEQDSNLRPTDYESAALTTEPWGRTFIIEDLRVYFGWRSSFLLSKNSRLGRARIIHHQYRIDLTYWQEAEIQELYPNWKTCVGAVWLATCKAVRSPRVRSARACSAVRRAISG